MSGHRRLAGWVLSLGPGGRGGSETQDPPYGRMPVRLAGIVLAMLAAVHVCHAQAPTLDAVLDRLSAYLLDYETKAFELAAEEDFEQSIKRRQGYGGDTIARRKIKSTFFLVRLPNGEAWVGFRDVASVDGRPIKREGRSMSGLLNARTEDGYAEAAAITRENAKYNIGTVYRTINVPLQAVELMHPQFRNRFSFRMMERTRVAGEDAVVIEYTEQELPSIISDGFGGDVRANGRLWVNPESGAVLRTELGFHGANTAYLKEVLIRVDFQRDRKLQLLLPSELDETYGLEIEVLRGHASYRNYRRFETGARLVTAPD